MENSVPAETAAVEHTRSRCALFQDAIELVGRRWSAAILTASAEGPTRYSDYLNVITGISDRLLTQRLKELAELDLLRREVLATTPVQVRYELTDSGRELMAAMEPLGAWGAKWLANPREPASAE